MMYQTAKLIAFLIGTCVTTGLLAQSYVDVVYLKNGSIVRGVIVEQVPNESLKLQTQDGSIFVFVINDVLKMTKEVSASQAVPAELDQSGGSYDRSGFVNITQVAFGIGVGKITGTFDGETIGEGGANSDDYFRIETINGTWLADGMLSVGLGLGLEYYVDSKSGYLPIFADLRLTPVKATATPTLILQAGYSVNVFAEESSGYAEQVRPNGFELGFGLGVMASLTERSAMHVSLLYDYQQFKSNYDLGYTDYDIDLRTGTLRLCLGFGF